MDQFEYTRGVKLASTYLPKVVFAIHEGVLR
jgi:hypothetical protein